MHVTTIRPSSPRPPRRGRLLAAAALVAGAAVLAVGLGIPPHRGTPPPSGVAGATPSPSGAGVLGAAPPSADPGASPAGPPDGTAQGLPAPAPGRYLTGGLLIADRGNGRILALDRSGRIIWRFPMPGALPPGETFHADDAFISPDGRTIVANDEGRDVIDRIDIATGRIVWQYGHYGLAGSAAGYLHTPDDAYPLPNGDVVVADIMNCRVLEIAPDRSIVRQWGRAGVCRDQAPVALNEPNGDTPLPDGGLLITEIRGSRVVRLRADGSVVFDVHVPVRYPSDAQLDANGDVVVADFSSPGQVVCVDPSGRLVWRYGPSTGPGRLDHPSLATPLADGTVSVNDDFRDRLVIIDPRSGTIVWQYGRTDVRGASVGFLSDPDGHQPLPPGAFGQS